MRNASLTLLALAGFLTLSQRPAHAIDYPYCMTYVQGWSGAIERCDFSTFAQCQASASGLNGSCAENWRLAYGKGSADNMYARKPRARY
ncbi:MAG: DUF3551 domain-containing protein [Pseudomonadota bacterium]